MVSRSTIKLATTLLERFFRETEGRTNLSIDLEYVFHEEGTSAEKAEEALQFLESRGLSRRAGFDSAFITSFGVDVVANDTPIDDLPRKEIEWGDSNAKQVKEETGEIQPEKELQAASDSVAARTPLPRDETTENEGAPRRLLTSERPLAPRLVIHVEGSDDSTVLALGKECTLGRIEDNDFQLDDPRASKRHAVIRKSGEQYELCDLDSANGTMLNGDYVKSQFLNHGDEIVIGRTIILFQSPQRASISPKDEADSDELSLPEIKAGEEELAIERNDQHESSTEAVAPADEDATIARPTPLPVQKPETAPAADALATIAAPPPQQHSSITSEQQLDPLAIAKIQTSAVADSVSTNPEISLNEALADTAESLQVQETPPIISSRFYRALQVLQQRLTDSNIKEKETMLAAVNLLAGNPSIQGLVTDLDDV